METVRFEYETYAGYFPAYSCSIEGDQSGEYVRKDDYNVMFAAAEQSFKAVCAANAQLKTKLAAKEAEITGLRARLVHVEQQQRKAAETLENLIVDSPNAQLEW